MEAVNNNVAADHTASDAHEAKILSIRITTSTPLVDGSFTKLIQISGSLSSMLHQSCKGDMEMLLVELLPQIN